MVAIPLVVGGVLLFITQSPYAALWTVAKTVFPDAGVHVLMVNTDATMGRRDRYRLPDEIKQNIALRALVVDNRNRVVATAWREGHLESFPGPTTAVQENKFDVAYLRVRSWMEAARAGGWLMVGVSGFQAAWLLIMKMVPRFRVRAIGKTEILS